MLAFAALAPFVVNAQLDSRQRTPETVVADALAQLPAETPREYNQIMKELAFTGSEGVEMLAAMLVPASEGQNAKVEYALNGMVDFVTAKGMEANAVEVKKGLKAALDKCTDNANKAFLMTLLQISATAEDADTFVKYLSDSYLADYAIRGLISTPGTEEVILDLVKNDGASRAALAYAVAEKGVDGAESYLLAWLPEADDAQKAQIYYALSKTGTVASLKTLADAAKAVGYAFEATDATGAYVALLNRLVEQGDQKSAVAAAKALLKSDRSNIKSDGLSVLVRAQGKDAMPQVLAALKSPDKAYRYAALLATEPFVDDEVYAAVAKKYKSASDEAKIDIINWLGASHAASQIDLVVSAIGDENVLLADAAIEAAGRIGGETALNALVTALGTDQSDAAKEALLAFNGDPNPGLIAALDGNAQSQVAALDILRVRRVKAASAKVFGLIASDNATVKAAAMKAISGTATPDDFDQLSNMLEQASADAIGDIQAGMKSALLEMTPDQQVSTVMARLSTAPAGKKALYYPVLAQAGNDQAIAEIVKGYEAATGDDKTIALNALLSIDNETMIDILYGIAEKDATNANKILNRFGRLVVDSQTLTGVEKYQQLRKGLELATNDKLKSQFLTQLAKTNTFQAMMVAAPYMDNAATAQAAANTVMTIAQKHPEFYGETVVAMLNKVMSVLNDSDAVYKVTSLKKHLAALPEGKGFYALFNGKDLADWSPVVANPVEKAKMQAKRTTAKQLAQKETEAAEAVGQCWKATANGVEYVGAPAVVKAIGTDKEYGNFELYIDWKTTGEAGIAVRSIPQVKIGGAAGSGALSGNVNGANTPSKVADNKPGEWNSFYMKVVDDRVTVQLNGETVTDNVILENALDNTIPAYVKGQIELLAGDAPVAFRDAYINELPDTPVFVLPEDEAAAGYEVLFDGTSMHKWTGNTTDYVTDNGTIYVTAKYGNGGNLYTKKEYSDFDYKFEFCFVRPGVNNGVGIRTPMGKDAAYYGMEIQILDHDDPVYKNLREYQVHGSVYGIIPAKRIKSPELNTWNTMEIRAVGDHITVTVNGEVIVDGNIREACQGQNVAPEGAKSNDKTVDHKNHPGLFNKSGHIGFLGHGAGVRFRNVRILDLSKDNK